MLAFAFAGAILLWVPAFRFRIDAVRCAEWPALGSGALYGLAYVAAVALLSVAWLRLLRREQPLGRILLLGALVHAVALLAPPFTSNDPLFYAAVGRALAHGGSTTLSLSQTLAPGDPFLQALPVAWRAGTSPYGPLFSELTRAIALVGGDSLTLQLRLYQVVGLLSLLGTAALTGRALGAKAACFILFCPLAILDGTVNPHNDTLVALAMAAFIWAQRRGRRVGLLALGAALFVKLSAGLVLAWELCRLFLRPLTRRLRPSALLALGAAAAALAVAVLIVAVQRVPSLHRFTALIGDPGQPPHVTRSFEGLPRAYLAFVVHAPFAAWALGLVVRAAAALWLFYGALRATRAAAPLDWLALTLFVYYLFFHAYLQAWYLLPLLPLGVALPAPYRRPFRLFVLCLTFYYALALPLDCEVSHAVVAGREVVEAALVILPTTIALLIATRARARACDESSPPGA